MQQNMAIDPNENSTFQMTYAYDAGIFLYLWALAKDMITILLLVFVGFLKTTHCIHKDLSCLTFARIINIIKSV